MKRSRDQVEQGDILGYFDRVVPRQYNHRGAELNPLRSSGHIRQ